MGPGAVDVRNIRAEHARDHQEGVHGPEEQVADREDVAGPARVGMVAHEGRPPLACRSSRAGLPDVSFHALRHTNATLLLQGVHPKMVQERLGHSTVSMTMDIYSHVLPRIGKDTADKLEALLA